jgi:hypothetical protein
MKIKASGRRAFEEKNLTKSLSRCYTILPATPIGKTFVRAAAKSEQPKVDPLLRISERLLSIGVRQTFLKATRCLLTGLQDNDEQTPSGS